jgi:hypothetical protein
MGVTNGEGNVIRVVKFVVFMVIVCLCSFYQSVVFFMYAALTEMNRWCSVLAPCVGQSLVNQMESVV